MSLKEVEFEGSPPWGFRMNGGADAGHPLRISRVNPGSKAELKGVREGDLITSINGEQTKCLTNSESHALLRTVKENLRLGLNEDSSPKRRSKEKPSAEQSEPSKESKPSSSKARRRRRSKLKSRFKELLGFRETNGKVINLHPFAKEDKEPEESIVEEVEGSTVVLVHNGPQNGDVENCDDVSVGSSKQESSTCPKFVASRTTLKNAQIQPSNGDVDAIVSIDGSSKQKESSTCSEFVASRTPQTNDARTPSNGNVESKSRDIASIDDSSKQKESSASPDHSRIPDVIFAINDGKNNLSECPFADINSQISDSLKRPVKFDIGSSQQKSDAVISKSSQTDGSASWTIAEIESAISAHQSAIETDFVNNATEVLICSPQLEIPVIKYEDEHIYEPVKPADVQFPPYSRRYLEVICEETSDLSESDKAEKTYDGIDTSWRDGKSLEEVSDVPVLSDSQSDEEKKRPSVSVVKNVISNYCSKLPVVVNSSTHKTEEKVELVYIDSSDSELFSSVLSSQSSDSIDTIITDVQETAKAMMSDEFLSGSDASLATNVLSLKELSIGAVMNLPNGLRLLEEVDSSFVILPEIYDGWVGLTVPDDPRLLVCLSPTQMKNSKSKDASQLLDLHEKFIQRRGYHESDDAFLALQKYHELRQKKSSHEVGNSRLLELFQTLDLQSSNDDSISRKMKDEQRPNSCPLSGEAFRERMYEEYMSKLYDLAERRNSKVIKLSSTNNSVPNVNTLQIQSEFMSKVKERMMKLGIPYEQQKKEETSQPKHLKELLELTKECSVWSPCSTPEAERKRFEFENESPKKKNEEKDDPTPPVWTPKSAGPSPTFERKFRSVNFQSPPPKRKEYQTKEEPELPKELPIEPNSRLVSSTSENSSLNSAQLRLPSAQNPTITLLQKAREGHIPKGAQYLEDTAKTSQETKYSVKNEYYTEEDGNTKHVIELTPKKFEGIGPTTREGIPIGLRSEVKEDNQQRWYKRMYDSLHKAEHDKDFVTVRYKTKRKGQYPYSGGYVSEPERLNYDSDASISKYATLDRRKIKNKENDFTSSTLPRNRYGAGVKHAVNIYKNQPGRIEDYEPGRSSISESEAKQWWDEVLDIFDGELNQQSRNHYYATPERSPRSFTYALKDTGYDSDSTLVFRRRENNMSQQLSPADQKEAYKVIQRGGEVPLSGLRKPAPERPKEPFGNPIPTPPRDNIPRLRSQESPHRYVESEVNIHYRSPIRSEAKGVWPEDELAEKQAEIMRRIYQEQRRTKYLNELHDMYSRRHTDNFIPSQKSPIPLNRYDDFPVDIQPPRPRDRTPEPKLVARALFNFVGQTSRELTFRRGDIIYVRRQIDKNWYEGEHNAMIGLFPFNYVEIIPYDGIRTLPKKASEGQARAKFNFQAQSHLELSLVKGELVLLTRRVDENWFEGRIGTRKGIFPVSYVEVLVEPGERAMSPSVPISTKPIVAPASHSVMLNGAKDLGQQHYQPPRPALYSSSSLPPQSKYGDISMVNQTLHIDTQNDPVPYRVLYNYRPQNEDELELKEGDVVYVMEKCDDGWYVGSLHRNGQFGTFPGNYVERIQ